MKLLRFLKSKTFFVNLIIIGLLLSGLFFGLNYYLTTYTQHGLSVKVPTLKGLALTEVETLLTKKELTYRIIDSAEYDPTFSRGSVIGQYPEAGNQVKAGRELKLTVNPFYPRKVELPNLVEKTKRRAIYDLESKGFKVGKLRYVPYIGKDVVMDVKIGERSLMPGTLLKKGTTIDLVLGQGLSDELVNSPYLRWKTKAEAEEYLKERSFNLGSVIYDDEITDTASTLVYRQNPGPSNEPSVRMGREIDLWLTNDYTKIAKDSLEFQLQTLPDTLANDTSSL
jgi:beta-lactam-binding protein with PASTA domain